MRVLAVAAVLVALISGSSANWYEDSQYFCFGLPYGFGVRPFGKFVSEYFSDSDLDPVSLTSYLGEVSSSNPDTRLTGIQNLNNLFLKFAARLEWIPDLDFKTVVNATLTVLASPEDFIHRAKVLKRHSGVDVYFLIRRAENFARGKHFTFTGAIFGWVIAKLQNVDSVKGIDTLKLSPVEKSMEQLMHDIVTNLIAGNEADDSNKQ